MKVITFLNEKGGTGKTTISVNLAQVAGEDVALLDCDAEEPNSHLFVKNSFKKVETIFFFFTRV